MQSKSHWESVYQTRAQSEVSWYQKQAKLSLKLIKDAKIPPGASVIDIGGGASTLVDDLLNNGFQNITVLDISGAALTAVKGRLGSRADSVHWLEANVLDASFGEGSYDVWHDRAVFHFLTAPEDRQTYVNKALHAVKPGGFVIVATFAEDGPTQCSGLPVMRYSASELHAEFGKPFALLHHEKESHLTPAGNTQQFVYCVCRRAN